MNTLWDNVGFVVSSQYRVAVLRRLSDGAATPSQIAADTGYQISHVSRAITGLRERGLVELLVPESRRKGRIYGVTSLGTEVWQLILTEKML